MKLSDILKQSGGDAKKGVELLEKAMSPEPSWLGFERRKDVRMKCNTCGNVFHGKMRACPNCFGRDTNPCKEDETWANRYDSEPMTKDEAEEYFDADNY